MPATRRQLLLGAAAAWGSAAQAQAAPFEVASLWPQVRLVGSGRLRFMGLRVYDARLWSPGALGPQDWERQPFALELHYARAFEGPLIAQRSLDEMRRQRAIDTDTAQRWLATMKATFPDVREGDRLTGVHRVDDDAARFFHNGRLRGEWRDSDFARQFFGIWLAPATSEPALREALLGQRT
jgi:hypothetical protein